MEQSTSQYQKKMSLLSLPLFATHVPVRHEKFNVNGKNRPESTGQKHYFDAFLVDTLPIVCGQVRAHSVLPLEP